MISHPKIALKGFTLLEVLLVICILIVLAVSFVDYLQKRQQQNIVDTATQQINTILTAAVQYQTTYIAWPNSLAALLPFNNAISLSSPWHNSTGTNNYVLTSTSTSHYFSVQVLVPNVSTAQKLVTALPNAYFSSGDNQVLVTAYTTAFIQLKYPPRPTGVLYGSTASSTKPNPSPSFTKIPYALFPQTSGTTTYGPFGIINVNQIAYNNRNTKPKDQKSESTTFTQTYTPIYNYADAPIGSKFTLNTEMACPNGSSATAVLFPVFARQTKTSFWDLARTAGFASVYTHLVSLDSNTFGGCVNAGFPYYNESSTASNQMDSYVGFSTDMVCLPNDNQSMKRWPDIAAGSTYCPPNSGAA